jgi:transcriptional regulator with XRE-family HTH domain
MAIAVLPRYVACKEHVSLEETHLSSIQSRGASAAETIGARVLAERQARGLTLEALAARAGVTRGFLSKIERGQSQPAMGTVFRLAEALGLAPAALFGATAPAVTPEGPAFAPLFPADPSSRLLAMTMRPPPTFRRDAKGSRHPGEEMLYVLSGTVEVAFDDRTVTVKANEALRFRGDLRHRTRSAGPEQAVALVIVALDPT